MLRYLVQTGFILTFYLWVVLIYTIQDNVTLVSVWIFTSFRKLSLHTAVSCSNDVESLLCPKMLCTVQKAMPSLTLCDFCHDVRAGAADNEPFFVLCELIWCISGTRVSDGVAVMWRRKICRLLVVILDVNIRILNTRVGTLIVTTIYLQLIQNRYMFRSFTVLQCSHQHCVQPVASDMEVVGYL